MLQRTAKVELIIEYDNNMYYEHKQQNMRWEMQQNVKDCVSILRHIRMF